MVEGLCATFGLRVPALAVVDDPVPNSAAVGVNPGAATLVVTSGLVEGMGLVELEAVVAHELAHIKRDDVVVLTIAAAVVGPVCTLTGSDRWMVRAIGSGREFVADDVAVTVVRYPPGLQRALEAMQSAPPPEAGSVFAASSLHSLRHFFVDPDVGRRDREESRAARRHGRPRGGPRRALTPGRGEPTSPPWPVTHPTTGRRRLPLPMASLPVTGASMTAR